jgi:D-alanyl-D-alanine carboxypeptidase/D-alanyl-D-alanine-endopeptidase (penicillin-binding protein 4)
LSFLTRTRAVSSRIDEITDILPKGSCLSVTWLGQGMVSVGPDTPLVPGSVMKLVTAAVALEVLGADHRFETPVRVTRNNDGSVMDLFLVGGGDPLLTRDEYIATEKYQSFNNTRLEDIADRIVASGVTAVSGRVVGVDTLLDAERFVPDWPASFHGVEAGPLGALMVSDGVVTGQPVKPDDPALAAAQELSALLAARGVSIGGGAAHDVLPEGTAELFVQQSAPLSAVAQEMLVNSDNNTAEVLLKHVGLARKGVGSTANGAAAAREILDEWGLTGGTNIVDGSGLSSANRLTCGVVMKILDRQAEVLPSLLAVAGETGTLRDLLSGTPAEGKLVGKTGTLSGVKGLAGYVPVEGEVPLEFTLLMNKAGIDNRSAYRPVWNRLAESVGRASASPRPDDLAP